MKRTFFLFIASTLVFFSVIGQNQAVQNQDYETYKYVTNYINNSKEIKRKIKKTFGRKAVKYKVANTLIENDFSKDSVGKSEKRIIEELMNLSINKASSYTLFLSSMGNNTIVAVLEWTGESYDYQLYGKVLFMSFYFNQDNKIDKVIFNVKAFE